jgi:hypothetical protein
MNPYLICINAVGTIPAGNLETAATLAALQYASDAYSSGYVAGPGNTPFDYVVAQVRAKFGASHPFAMNVARLFAEKLGR